MARFFPNSFEKFLMQDSRDFARLPLGSLIVRCALPAMVSMSAMALYSVIDGVFVGYFLGASALAAINLVFPMFMMFSSVIDMLAAGSSVQIATRLGAGKRREASKIFSFCHGAGLAARTRRLQKAVMGVAGVLSIGALVLLQCAGPWALTFFVQPGDTALMELSLTALSIFALSYLVKWVDICVSSYFTALEQPAVSLALSLLGTLLAPLAALAILVPVFGLTGVWWMPFCAGVISAVVSLVTLRRGNAFAVR